MRNIGALFQPIDDSHPLLAVHTEADQKLEQYGLAQQGWRFELSSTKMLVGQCFYQRKLIVYSQHYIEGGPELITDTILHEIAHALVGPGHHHDYIWKAKAASIGANPSYNAEEVRSTAKPNYIVTCPQCKWREGRYRLKRGLLRAHCIYCGTQLKVYHARKD